MHDTYAHWKPTTRPSTARAYAYAWRRYTDWCAEVGREPWQDPDGDTFAEFVKAMTRAGLKVTTIRQCRAAIIYRYATDPALYGLEDPAKTAGAKNEMAIIGERDLDRRVPQALPMTPDVLEKVLAASAVRRSGEAHDAALLRHAEAEATLGIMYDAALRCDDMARVEWGDLDPTSDDDGNRTLYVRPGKTRDDRYAPVSPSVWAALQRWRAACPTPYGKITSAGSAQAIGQRIRRLGDFAGVPITGHSPRRGRATAAARNGATEYDVMSLCGWKSPKIAAGYVEPLKANKVAARVFPNGHAEPEPDPEPVAVISARVERIAASTSALDMARRLGASRDHPEVAPQRARFAELWPLPDPPLDCARDDCPGFVLTANPRPDERYCCDQCRQIARNARRRANRKDTT